MTSGIVWPEGKRFAFTVFDDTDSATLENVAAVYAFLADCGFRTTKSCWPVRGDPTRAVAGADVRGPRLICDWLLQLQAAGFEIGWHGGTWHSASREATLDGLDKFARYFGHDPYTAANHSGQAEAIYWGGGAADGEHTPCFTTL